MARRRRRARSWKSVKIASDACTNKEALRTHFRLFRVVAVEEIESRIGCSFSIAACCCCWLLWNSSLLCARFTLRFDHHQLCLLAWNDEEASEGLLGSVFAFLLLLCCGGNFNFHLFCGFLSLSVASRLGLSLCPAILNEHPWISAVMFIPLLSSSSFSLT